MTSKELHRLHRRELLQILLTQSEETRDTAQRLKEAEEELATMSANYERLRKRLDMKDARIAELRAALEAERTKREIELNEAGNIAEAALKLNGIFEAAQRAADQYIHNIKSQTGKAVQAAATEQNDTEVHHLDAEEY